MIDIYRYRYTISYRNIDIALVGNRTVAEKKIEAPSTSLVIIAREEESSESLKTLIQTNAVS